MEKKKVLIVGRGSYIGESFKKRCLSDYDISSVDSFHDLCVSDFKGFDAVFHVAGIAHIKKTRRNQPLFFRINRDFAIQSAKMAKEAGVKQFLFMSSESVYGIDTPIWKTTVITKETPENPIDAYGESKLEAEREIEKMASSSFRVVILRAPMVYGPGCKGNYPKLEKLSLLLPFIPKLPNRNSMLSIDNLVSHVKDYIDSETLGLFFPRDESYFCTYLKMEEFRRAKGKKVRLTVLFNPLIRFFSIFIPKLRKMFGNRIYSENLPE